MKARSHNYKQLILPGIAGLVIFLFLMRDAHPPAHIAELSSRQEVMDNSGRFLQASGYQTHDLVPFVTFRTNDELIRQQVAHFGKRRFNEFIQNGFLQFIPSYYWQVLWIDTGHGDEPSGEINITIDSYKQPIGTTIFRTKHSPGGSLQTFHIEHSDFERYDSGNTLSVEMPDLSSIEPGGTLTGVAPLRKAVKGTVWDNYMMRIDSTYQSDVHNLPAHAVMMQPESDVFGHIPLVTLMLTPDGNLLDLHQEVLINDAEEPESTGFIGVTRAIFFGFALLIPLVIFFRRLFQRLIDLRSATLYGIIAFGICLLQVAHMLFQFAVFEQTGIQVLQIVGISITMMLLAGVVGIFVFMFSGLGESLTREAWPEKITSLGLLRLGYIRSRSVGRSLISGVFAAFLVLGIMAVVYSISDHSYFNPLDDQFFYAESYYFSPWQIFFRCIFWMFMIVIGLYACIISWTSIQNNRMLLLLPVGAIAFALMTSLQIETPGSSRILLMTFFPGLALTYIYLRHDLLTIFVAVFLFLAAWATVDGWVVSQSPDVYTASSVFVLMFLVLGGGVVLAHYGREYEHVPELTPDYIREISREQRVERELEIAHQVHQSFLPVDLPQLEGLEIAANCKAAFDVGGDYYDVIPLDSHRLAFVIGDVSGKGIQAAFYMTMVKGIFQSLVKEIPDPVALLTRMNRLFYHNARRGSFISLCYGLVDTHTGELQYARAGHNPAILIPGTNGDARMLRPGGLAIGLTTGSEFAETLENERLVMQPGDTLVFYTDGLTEAANLRGEMFGDDRLLQEMSSLRHLPADELITQMNKRIVSFTDDTPMSDDMTMVVVRYKKRVSPSE